MVTTTGQPERSHWATGDMRDAFASEAVQSRGYLNFPGDLDAQQAAPLGDPMTHSEELERAGLPVPNRKRSSATEESVRAAVADALGMNAADLDEDMDFSSAADILDNDLTEEDARAALDALDRALADPRMVAIKKKA